MELNSKENHGLSFVFFVLQGDIGDLEGARSVESYIVYSYLLTLKVNMCTCSRSS